MLLLHKQYLELYNAACQTDKGGSFNKGKPTASLEISAPFSSAPVSLVISPHPSPSGWLPSCFLPCLTFIAISLEVSLEFYKGTLPRVTKQPLHWSICMDINTFSASEELADEINHEKFTGKSWISYKSFKMNTKSVAGIQLEYFLSLCVPFKKVLQIKRLKDSVGLLFYTHRIFPISAVSFQKQKNKLSFV